MSVKQMAKVWEHEFPHNQQSVMLALTDHANDFGEKIFPAIARIAWKTGYKPRQVSRILKQLRELGILVVVKKAYKHRPTEYKVDWSQAMPKEPYLRDDIMSKLDEGGVTNEVPRDDISKSRDDIAVSKEPSLIKPSLNKPSKKNIYTNDIKKQFVFVLADVMDMDAGLNFPKLAKWGKVLHGNGYTPTQISEIYGYGGVYWKQDWRGKKGQPPNFSTITGTIKKLAGLTKKNPSDKYITGKYAEFVEH